jgi:hypothetical protein
MNIIASISNFINRGENSPYSKQNLQKKEKPQGKPQDGYIKSEGPEPGFEFLDGMSTGTARFIIDREVDPDILKKYDIKELENKGRYYLAKIVNQDGDVAETVLIDKLNRSIHFQKTKLG